jgi:hypothetical protein
MSGRDTEVTFTCYMFIEFRRRDEFNFWAMEQLFLASATNLKKKTWLFNHLNYSGNYTYRLL